MSDPYRTAFQDQCAAEARDNTPKVVTQAAAVLAEVGDRGEALARIAGHLLPQDPRAVAVLAADAVLRLAEQARP